MDIWFDLYSKNAFASLRNTICHPYVCLCLIGACTLALSNFGEGLGLVGIWDPHIRRQANPPSQAEEGSIRRTSGARAHRAVPEPLRRCVTRRDATRRDATRRNAAGFERQTRSEFSELLACTCQAQEQRGVERCAAARTIAAQAIKLCNREQRDHGPTSHGSNRSVNHWVLVKVDRIDGHLNEAAGCHEAHEAGRPSQLKSASRIVVLPQSAPRLADHMRGKRREHALGNDLARHHFGRAILGQRDEVFEADARVEQVFERNAAAHPDESEGRYAQGRPPKGC
mmetsp:Transcript_17233/g.54841  ORF Transcript_17233/g.54841 Transcript_17233/m.54841 type:complete len:284 (+) Transcript_17233:2990-3841(+)